MNHGKELSPAKKGPGDIVHLVVKAALSAVPIVGGPAVEFFAALVSAPLDSRRQEWMNQVTSRLNELSTHGLLKLDQLKDNPSFITMLLQATQAAIRNHQAEKLAALRNLVLNSALPGPPEEALEMMFLNFIDTCTDWHLTLLRFFDDPRKWAAAHSVQFPNYSATGLSNILVVAFPELAVKRPFYELVWGDLRTRGLVEGDLNVTMTADGAFRQHTTDIGRTLLKFISEPDVK